MYCSVVYIYRTSITAYLFIRVPVAMPTAWHLVIVLRVAASLSNSLDATVSLSAALNPSLFTRIGVIPASSP